MKIHDLYFVNIAECYDSLANNPNPLSWRSSAEVFAGLGPNVEEIIEDGALSVFIPNIQFNYVGLYTCQSGRISNSVYLYVNGER